MRKVWKILALLLALALAFLAGWRVMPKVWPAIKTNVVYKVLPQLEPSPTPVVTPTPYVPEANAALGDPVAATDSVIYYFYKDYCPYCAQLEPLMAGLPEHVYLADGTVSQVRLICLNKNDEAMGAVIAAYYDAHGTPEEERYVPAVVIGDRYLMPGREIMDEMLDALVAGEGLHTPLIDGAQRVGE